MTKETESKYAITLDEFLKDPSNALIPPREAKAVMKKRNEKKVSASKKKVSSKVMHAVNKPLTTSSTTKEKHASPLQQQPPATSDNAFPDLWCVAAASKARKPKETQVWLDDSLYRKIEMLNIKNGKPVPTKHLVNAALKLFLDEYKGRLARPKVE